MGTFNLTATVTISIYTKVEANTLKEAIKIAEERNIEQADWFGDIEKHAWVSDEFDGEPQNIRED